MMTNKGCYVWLFATTLVVIMVAGFGTALPVQSVGLISEIGLEDINLQSNVVAGDDVGHHLRLKRGTWNDAVDLVKKPVQEITCNVLYDEDVRVQLCMLRFYIKDTVGIDLSENGSVILVAVVGLILLLLLIQLCLSCCKLICGRRSSSGSSHYVHLYPNRENDSSKLIGVEMSRR